MVDMGNESGITVSVSVLTQLVRYLDHLGTDRSGIFRSAGVDPKILERPDSRISLESYMAVEEEAARVTADPCFGLHMGEFAEPGSWSILGFMMMNCRTLGEAAEKVARYQRIIGNMITVTAQQGIGKAKLIHSAPKYLMPISRHCFESAMSSSIRIMRLLSGKEIDPLEVGFIYDAPESLKEYNRIFRCPVLFRQKHNYMTVAMNIGNTPVILPNPNLLAHFEKYAEQFLEQLEEENTTTGRVIKTILPRLDSRKLTIGMVAKELAMSVRTLQNRLQEEGKVFSELLRETREQLAKRCLQENYTVEDITYMVGFSDPSVFRKAFKKWTGTTPREYRQRVYS